MWFVRLEAVETLAKLEVAALAPYEQAIAKAAKEDSDVEVQIAARVVMHKLEPAAGHMDAVVAKLEDSDWHVRQAAVQTLGELDLASLAQHEQAIAKAAMEDEDKDVRDAADEVLAKLRAGQ